jgi:hypothetical protein
MHDPMHSIREVELVPSATELSALTRLFSSAVIQEMAKKGRSSLFTRLIEQAGVVGRCSTGATVGEAFDSAFDVLKSAGLRDEYVYRAAITKKILMGKHSLRTASMLSEFRAGVCKADLVILNGTATVYEIKSERDSLARLLNQITNYMRVFASVNVIVGESHRESVLEVVPDDVGVMCLSKRYSISVIRDARDRPERICPVAVFESLRTGEAIAILQALDVAAPEVPNTQRHSAMRTLFAKLDPVELHGEFVRTLKRTRNLTPLSNLVDKLPQSLHAAALSIPFRRADHVQLVAAISTPLNTAMSWI